MGVSRQTGRESISDRKENNQGPWGLEMKGLLVVSCGWGIRLM